MEDGEGEDGRDEGEPPPASSLPLGERAFLRQDRYSGAGAGSAGEHVVALKRSLRDKILGHKPLCQLRGEQEARMEMKGLVAIVTGASRGIGRAIAKEYARQGAKVVVTARPQTPTGLTSTVHDTAREIQEAGGEALAVSCDAADGQQVQAMVRQVTDRYGRIDVLVNNAGLYFPRKSSFEIEPERWELLMSVNVRGPYLTCRQVLPTMRCG